LHFQSATRGRFEDKEAGLNQNLRPVTEEEPIMGKMKKVKSGVKGVLNQRVRLGLFTVPLWMVGLVFVARQLRNRRRTVAVATA
jgi:hypothetical protein